jgi:hypothetical protein
VIGILPRIFSLFDLHTIIINMNYIKIAHKKTKFPLLIPLRKFKNPPKNTKIPLKIQKSPLKKNKIPTNKVIIEVELL